MLLLAWPWAGGGEASAQRATGHFLVDQLEYVAWDGSQWTVRRDGGALLRWPRGGSPASAVADAAVRFRGWDEGRWNARWEAETMLVARETGSGATSEELHYVDWSGRKWSARWDRSLQRFRVAPAD